MKKQIQKYKHNTIYTQLRKVWNTYNMKYDTHSYIAKECVYGSMKETNI